MERATGFEPATSTLGRWHSTAELRPLVVDVTALLVQSPSVAFKHNIPLPVLIFGLVAAVLAGLVFFHTPPDEDLLRQAADKHVATLGPIKQLEMHGNVADILTDDGRSVFAEFEKRNGTWTYARDLAEEFAKAMKEPDIQTTVLRHLGEKISQRFQSTVTFHEKLREFRYDLARDLGTDQLIGSCSVKFAYPKVGDNAQRGGLYVETFEWKDGAWRSGGPGTLYDALPPK